MKYEAVFGNQELFDGAGTFTGLDVVVHSIASGIKSYARLSDLTPESLRNHPVCAMRRIIPEPKRWTLEDKKAGMLPEVGSLVEWNDCGVKLKVTIESAFFNKSCAFSFEGRGIGIAEIFDLSPIETPEEKAQREESEFVMSLMLTSVHSGTSDEYFMQGARAAYRKLKGGE